MTQAGRRPVIFQKYLVENGMLLPSASVTTGLLSYRSLLLHLTVERRQVIMTGVPLQRASERRREGATQ